MDEIAFIESILPELKNLNNLDYKKNRFTTYKNYINQSEIPESYKFEMQPNPFSHFKCFNDNAELCNFVADITDYLEGEFNCIFNLGLYINADKLAAHIIQNYIKSYLRKEDGVIKQIIYINTPLLMTDLKRMISYSTDSDTDRTLVHNLDTIKRGVENADFIIWDRMTDICSDYDRAELYKILSIRHKRGLGNLFFITGGKNVATQALGAQVIDLFYGNSMIDIE